MYKVIVRFKDLQDNRFVYNPGDTFPRDGLTVADERIQELISNKNRRGIGLIIPEPDLVKKTIKKTKARSKEE